MHTSKLDCQDILSDAVKVQLRARLDASNLALSKIIIINMAQPRVFKACIPTNIALICLTIACKQGVYALFHHVT